MTLPTEVTIKEVGPRDGLQNEKKWLATEDKVAWINQLSACGFTSIEISSFVSPKWIPALKDAEEVARLIERKDRITYSALVPNQRGLERALRVGVDEVAVFMSASETHNQKNIAKSISETLPVLKEVIREAKQENKQTRAYLSTVFGCPYEGQISSEQIFSVIEALVDMDVDEISLGDTIGVAHPKQVEQLLVNWQKHYPKEKCALHFHDTRGLALANIHAALRLGFTTFDASTAGLGGCPYAPGASGNVATEDLLYMLHHMGIKTGLDEQAILEASQFVSQKLHREQLSHNLQVYMANRETYS